MPIEPAMMPVLAISAILVFSGFFAMAALVSALATLFILKTQQTAGMDKPDALRKTHSRPVSRLGGAAIFLAVIVGMAAALQAQDITWERWWPVILCNTLMFGVGFLDDLKALGAKTKLVGQLGAAVILFSLGTSIDMLSNPFGEGSIHLGWLSLPLTVAWLVAIPNIVNLIDGMDGLATGFGMFVSLTLAFVGHMSEQPDVVYASLVMAGALAGFLIFNFPPAKIFLGDGGAYLIGFYIASVSLLSSQKGAIIAALLVMMVALGVPILDTFFAIVRRAVRGVPIFKADAEHIHHRLIVLGYSKGQALVAMYAVCLVLSLVGISILYSKGITIPIAGAFLFILAVAAARYLGYVRSWKDLRSQVSEAVDRRREIEYLNAHARLLEMEVERCSSADEFAAVLARSMERMGLTAAAEGAPGCFEVLLGEDGHARLRAAGHDDHPLEKAARCEAMTACLQAAWSRWGSIPNLTVTVRPGEDNKPAADVAPAKPQTQS